MVEMFTFCRYTAVSVIHFGRILMLKELLYMVVEAISVFHDGFMRLNDTYGWALTDKELHFLVIGLVGMVVFLVVNPLFKSLAKHDMVGAISWIYTTTVIVVLTFAIEIGQHITGTGNMEFADIFFGVIGFLAMHLCYTLIVFIVRTTRSIILRIKQKKGSLV